MIQLKQAHGRSAAGRERFNTAGHQTKVFHPSVAARVEKRHNGSGFSVNGGQIASFEAIAQSTGQGEIVDFGGAAVFLGNDVIDFVRCERHRLWEEAILATVARP
jgi:hypothetical protein